VKFIELLPLATMLKPTFVAGWTCTDGHPSIITENLAVRLSVLLVSSTNYWYSTKSLIFATSMTPAATFLTIRSESAAISIFIKVV